MSFTPSSAAKTLQGFSTSYRGKDTNYIYINPPTFNIGIGKDAAYNIIGKKNMGQSNLFVGFGAGYSDTSGYGNLFFGLNTGYANTMGSENVFIGNYSGRYNVHGNYNATMGSEAGKNVRKDYNVAIGAFNDTSMLYGDSSYMNTSIGAQSKFQGSSNIVVGFSNITTANNSIVIGNNIQSVGNNNIIINNRPITQTSGSNYVNIADLLIRENGKISFGDTGTLFRIAVSESSISMIGSSNMIVELNESNINLSTQYQSLVLSSNGTNLMSQPPIYIQSDTLINLSDSVHITNSNVDFSTSISLNSYWREYMDVQSNLLFESRNGAIIEFNEIWSAGVLNFTGKHRCFSETIDEPRLGQLVYATGKYKNLEEEDSITIDEAIPIVSLTNKPHDQRIFGVIGGVDLNGEFQLGNMKFRKKLSSMRLIVQSHGEGAILICNINGDLLNGDYITSSEIPGIGMRQKSKLRFNHTIAKITCDCLFDSTSEEYIYLGEKLRTKLVGCIYV